MKVEKYFLKNWKDTETGLLIDENEDWILVKSIPIDYVVDGYKIFKKQFIEKRECSNTEKQIEKVLRLKNIERNKPDKFNFSDTVGLLKWVEKTYGIFEFQDDEETELFYGRINRIDGEKLIIDMINSDGSVDSNYDYEYNIRKIRIISFESDYHQSIQLLWNDKLKD